MTKKSEIVELITDIQKMRMMGYNESDIKIYVESVVSFYDWLY